MELRVSSWKKYTGDNASMTNFAAFTDENIEFERSIFIQTGHLQNKLFYR